MGTTLRAELSISNPYFIEKHRHYELKHFCLQYPSWKRKYSEINALSGKTLNIGGIGRTKAIANPTERIALAKHYYSERISLVEETAKETNPMIWQFLLRGITEGLSYDLLKIKMDIPCGKDMYYENYRKFFWLLDKKRG